MMRLFPLTSENFSNTCHAIIVIMERGKVSVPSSGVMPLIRHQVALNKQMSMNTDQIIFPIFFSIRDHLVPQHQAPSYSTGMDVKSSVKPSKVVIPTISN